MGHQTDNFAWCENGRQLLRSPLGEAESIGDKSTKCHAEDAHAGVLLSETGPIPSQPEAIIRARHTRTLFHGVLPDSPPAMPSATAPIAIIACPAPVDFGNDTARERAEVQIHRHQRDDDARRVWVLACTVMNTRQNGSRASGNAVTMRRTSSISPTLPRKSPLGKLRRDPDRSSREARRCRRAA
jgi:hypothetical protein